MLDQAQVDRWLAEYVQRLRDTFGDRLMYVGHHGSWARGEAGPDSDIDTLVILNRIEPEDLAAYRRVVDAMPDSGRLASSALQSISELKAWSRTELAQCYYGCRALHGTLDGLLEKPTDADLIEEVRLKAGENLHHARHYLLHPHDLAQVVHRLRDAFKVCFFALQSWILLREGRFIGRKADLLEALSDPDDRDVVRVSRDWDELEYDRTARPLYYIQLLERWSRRMLERLPPRG